MLTFLGARPALGSLNSLDSLDCMDCLGSLVCLDYESISWINVSRRLVIFMAYNGHSSRSGGGVSWLG